MPGITKIKVKAKFIRYFRLPFVQHTFYFLKEIKLISKYVTKSRIY